MRKDISNLFSNCTSEVQDYIGDVYNYFSEINDEANLSNFKMLCAVKQKFPNLKIKFEYSKSSQFDPDNMVMSLNRKNYIVFLHECGHLIHYICNKFKVSDEFYQLKNEINSNQVTINRKCEEYINKIDEILKKYNNDILYDVDMSEEKFQRLQIEQKCLLELLDMIDATLGGITSKGHGGFYYKDDVNYEIAYSEIFANYFAIRASSVNQFMVGVLKKCFGEKFIEALEHDYQNMNKQLNNVSKKTKL